MERERFGEDDELPRERPGPGEEELADEISDLEDTGPEDTDEGHEHEETVEPVHAGRPQASRERIKELRAQARAEAERAANAERELYALRMQQEAQARQQQAWQTQQEEEQNLGYMSEEQRVDYKLRKAQEDNKRQLQQLQFQNVMSADKAEYLAKCANDANKRRLAQVVEQTYYQSINAGRYIPREEIYRWARGKEIEDQEAAQGSKRRVSSPQAQAQRVRAPNSRSDSATSRSRGGGRNETMEQRERRLENVRF